MDVFPDFGGVGGVNDLRAAIGALLTFVLVLIIWWSAWVFQVVFG